MSKSWKYKIFGLIVLAVVFVNFILPIKEFSLADQARNATISGQHGRAKNLYSELLETAPNSIELHRKKVRSHFNSPTEDHLDIKNYYRALSMSDDKTKSDIGNYILGFIGVMQKNDNVALNYYLKIKDTKLPFVNNSIGYIYLKEMKYDLAEIHFLKEIELEGYIKGAYSNLSKVYSNSADEQSLNDLLKDGAISEYLLSSVVRHHYLQTGQLKEYSKVGFKLGNFTKLGLIGAIFILSIWLIFLRKIDIFEPEQPHHILITLLLACFFAMLSTPLYDLFSLKFGLNLTGNYINDLLFCIIGIGFIEETLKIIPFLIMFRFKNIINESVDYIIYASVCALGFAFMENLIYFHPGGLDDMVSRMLSAVVLHMALTSFVAFGLVYADYKKKASRVKYFLIAFVVSCIVHGVYDFWLLSDGWVGDLKVISIGILMYALLSYSIIINNVLNLSEFNSGGVEKVKTLEFLLTAIAMMIVYQYLVIATEYGVANGNLNLLLVMLVSCFPILIITCLGYFKISKFTWKSPVQYYQEDSE